MRRKIELNQKRIYKNNVQERSHLEGGQESKHVDEQTKLQPNSNQTSSNVTYKHSCSLAKTQTRRRIERETKRMRKNEENESYL